MHVHMQHAHAAYGYYMQHVTCNMYMLYTVWSLMLDLVGRAKQDKQELKNPCILVKLSGLKLGHSCAWLLKPVVT